MTTNNQRNNASRDENLQLGIQITQGLLQQFEQGTCFGYGAWGNSFQPYIKPLFGKLAMVLDDQALIGLTGAVLDFLQNELENDRKKREEVIAENKKSESSEKIEKIFSFVLDKSIVALLGDGEILPASEYIIPEEHRGRCELSKYAQEAAELVFFAQTVLVSIQIIMRQHGLDVKEAFARFTKTTNFLEQSVEPRLKNDAGWLFITQLVAQLETSVRGESVFGYVSRSPEMVALIQKNQSATPQDYEDQLAEFVHCLGKIVEYSNKLFGPTKVPQPQCRQVAESGVQRKGSHTLSEEQMQFVRNLVANLSRQGQ